MFHRIPDELKQYPQWVVWRSVVRGDKIAKPPFHPNISKPIDANDYAYWLTFDQAVAAVEAGKAEGIGFVLTKNDPYTIIDLDEPATEKNRDLHRRICESFDTYQELSPSGKGSHIVCKGTLPSGRNSTVLNVEVYPHERYMTFTGNVTKDLPIAECQSVLDHLYSIFDSKELVPAEVIEGRPQLLSDDEVLNRARTSKNGAKFERLWNEQLQKGNRSEGDMGLMNCLVFHSRNGDQSFRLWKQSPRAAVATDRNDNYIWNMVRKGFDEIVAKEQEEAQWQNVFQQELQAYQAKKNAAEPACVRQEQRQFEDPSKFTRCNQNDTNNLWAMSSLPRPPGLLGEIADYSLAGAPYPLPEAAIAAAVGLLSGMAGRAYNVKGQGLNHYCLLVAGSGTGKDRMHKVITNLLNALATANTDVYSFRGPNSFTTDTALRRVFKDSKFNSMVSTINEFSAMFKKVNDDRDRHGAVMRSMFLELFTLSEAGSLWGASAYAEKANSVDVIEAPSFSFVGDIQPKLFDDTVDENSVVAGFVPRLLCLHGSGLPEFNVNANDCEIPTSLFHKLQSLFSVILTLHNQTVLQIQIEDSVLQSYTDLVSSIDSKRRRHFNHGVESAQSIVTSRIAAKTIKLAGLVAVGCNPTKPVIDRACYEWAYTIVNADISNLVSKLNSGNIIVGNLQVQQAQVLKSFCLEWIQGKRFKPDRDLANKYPPLKPNGHLSHLITTASLKRRASRMKVFSSDRDFNKAFFSALRSLVSDGILSLVDTSFMMNNQIPHRGEFYAISVDSLTSSVD